jgi:hypothetical protein
MRKHRALRLKVPDMLRAAMALLSLIVSLFAFLCRALGLFRKSIALPSPGAARPPLPEGEDKGEGRVVRETNTPSCPQPGRYKRQIASLTTNFRIFRFVRAI